MSDGEYGSGGGSDEEGTSKVNIGRCFYELRDYLRSLDGQRFASFEEINRECGIDLYDLDELIERIQESDMFELNDREVRFKPRFHIHDVPSLLEALEKHPTGIAIEEIIDCSNNPDDIREEVLEAIHGGLCICIKCKAQGGIAGGNSLVLFPAGETFLAPLSGTFTNRVQADYKLVPTEDVSSQVRPGDAVLVGEGGLISLNAQRVDTYLQRVSNGDPGYDKIERIAKNMVPYSRSNTPRPSEKINYQPHLDYEHNMFIEPGGVPEDATGLTVYKHGCHNDIRDVWGKVCAKYPFSAGKAHELDRELLANNLIKKEWLDEAVSSMDFLPRPKIKRPRQNNRIRKRTNNHLD